MKKTIITMIVLTILVVFLRMIDFGVGQETMIESSKIDEKAKIDINVNYDLEPSRLLSEIVEKVDYIPLEETEQSLLGDISEIIISQNRIYVLDKISNKLVVFDTTGKFLFDINKIGNGPGEFNTINTFDLDINKNELILSSDNKIIWFDNHGEYLRELKTVYANSIDMSISSQSQVYLYTSYLPILEQNKGHYDLYELSNSGQLINGYLPIDAININHSSILSLFSNFSKSPENEILLTRPYSNQIIAISEDEGVYLKYFLDFGDRNLPKDYEASSLSDKSLSLDKRLLYENEKGYIRLSGNSIQETPTHLHFRYNYKGDIYYAFYNKTHDKITYQYDLNTKNDVDGSRYLINLSTFGERFVSYTYPSTLHKAQKNGLKLEKKALQLIEKLPENSENPILRLVCIKNE